MVVGTGVERTALRYGTTGFLRLRKSRALIAVWGLSRRQIANQWGFSSRGLLSISPYADDSLELCRSEPFNHAVEFLCQILGMIPIRSIAR
jgi:hypothetical protein